MNNKRPVVIALAVVLLSLLAWAPGAYAYLSDLLGHWSAGVVAALEAREIIAGGGDGRFLPDAPLTRAQLAKMLVVGLGYEDDAEALMRAGSRYTDVPAWHWARGYVEVATELGLLQGYPDGSFAPDAPISRAELAVIAARTAGLGAEAQQGKAQTPPYVDGAAVPEWAQAAVSAVSREGLMQGMPDGWFRPERAVTRAEGAAVTYRLLARRGALFHLAGTLVEFDLNTRTGVVRDSAGVEHSFQMAPTAMYMRGAEPTIFTQIRPMDEVVIVLDETGKGKLLQAAYADLLAEEAEVVEGHLLLRFASGAERRYAVNPGAILLVNGHPGELADLNGAAPVYAVLDGQTGGLRLVHALRNAAVGMLLGVVGEGEQVLLAVDLQAHQYPLAPDVVVLLDGERGDLSRVLPGEQLRFALDGDGRLTYVEVLR